MERPSFDAEVNVVGTVNALEAARAAGAHLVFSSTGGAIYGSVDEPAREDSPLRPVSAYGLAKLSAEAYLDGWNRIFATRHVALRFANVYGPRQSASLEGGVVAIFLERLAAGEPTTIFGDGTIARDFVHVDDIVRALLLAGGKQRRRLQRRHRRRDHHCRAASPVRAGCRRGRAAHVRAAACRRRGAQRARPDAREGRARLHGVGAGSPRASPRRRRPRDPRAAAGVGQAPRILLARPSARADRRSRGLRAFRGAELGMAPRA